MRRIITRSLVVLVVIFLVSSAFGSEDTPASKDWEFSLAPFYLWAIFMEGDMTIKGITAPVDVDFGDAIKHLEAVLTLHGEVLWKKKWGGLVDFSYVNLGEKQSTPGSTVDVDLTTILTELAGFYRVRKGPHTLDVLGGIRYTYMATEIDFRGTPFETKKREDWLDPIVGLRYRWNFLEKWNLSLRGDIGGFGIGDASDLAWNLVGLVDFQPWKHVSVFGGYRAYGDDYEKGSGLNKFKYDVTMHGPLVGFNIVW